MSLEIGINELLRRQSKRKIINQFYSVEINCDGTCLMNQFVIYDISKEGLCLLIEDDSLLLENIEVGGVYKMKYYPLNLLDNVKYIETEISHITKANTKKFDGHYLVGLSIKNEQVWD